MRQLEKIAPRPVNVALKNAKSSGIARICVLLTLLVFCCSEKGAALDPTSHISQYGHTVWRLQDGYFGGAAPSSVTQTTDGYIWVGTKAGLYRFDGVSFVRWKSPFGEELPSSNVAFLLGAPDGSLWIGTYAGLAHLVKDRLIVFEENRGWYTADFASDKGGKIWFMGLRPEDRALYFCEALETGVRCYGSKEEGLDGFLLMDTQGRSDDLWLAGPKGIIKWRPGAQLQAILSGPISQISFVVPGADGSAWLGTHDRGRGGGLQRLIDGTLRPFLTPKLNGETIMVQALYDDRQGDLWVGTDGNGLYRIRGTDVDHYGTAEGLTSDVVMGLKGIFEDREGDIWVVTEQGLDMFRDLPVRRISKLEGLDSDGVDSVAAARDGSVWIGGTYLQLMDHEGGFSELGKDLSGNQIAATFVDHAGRLWAGMGHKLFVYEQGRFRAITKADGSDLDLGTGRAVGITEDTEHNIWVESNQPPAALLLIQDLKVRKELRPPAVPLARKIAADPRGGIWLGLMTGDLAHYRDGQINTFSFGDHPKSFVNAIMVASDGSVLGATGFGVVGWKDGKKQTLDERNGLPSNEINSLISDNAGNLWLYAQCGLIKIENDQMQLWWEHPDSKLWLRVFGTFDGVQPGLAFFNNSAKTPDGRLWFANGIVVQVIDPAHVHENTVLPPVYINALVADHKAYAQGSAIRLPPLTRDLEIDYTALSFVVPQKVLFRYMLEGYDTGWQDPGTRRQAFYNNLRPDHYRFRVIACNNDGVWNSAGASVDFSILPAYYQTAWFRLTCAVVVLLLLWAFYRLRLRQLARQFNVRLEERIDERTRIARELHDTLLQSFHGLMLQFQAVRNMLPGKPEKAERALDEAIFETEQALSEGRDAIRDLRPEGVAQRDLAELLNATGRELAVAQEDDRHSPTLRVTVEGEPQSLSVMLQDEVFRIAREVIRNAFRHAAASRIEVEIHYGEDQLRLRIRDDGKGIDAKAVEPTGRPGHWGIPGIRERAQRIGSRLEFWSEEGAGTEVELTVPAAIAYEKQRDGHRFRLFRKAGSDGQRS